MDDAFDRVYGAALALNDVGSDAQDDRLFESRFAEFCLALKGYGVEYHRYLDADRQRRSRTLRRHSLK